MDSDTEASELDPSDLEERDLWARLPKKFREQVGKSGGQLPRDEILGFLVDSEAEALELMAEFASDDGLAGRCLVELWTRVLPRTQRLCQRRGRVDPALQSLVVSSAAAPSIESAEAQQTLSWLKLQSGACRQFRSWSARQRGQSECVQTQQSRADLEATELKRWRASLAELVIEADLPVSHHAQLTSNPEAIIAALLGSMRATTIRKRVREWRKVRNFSLQLCGHAWPTHVGVVLDYLHERMEEPCARTVPEAVLAALAFMENAGSVAAADRLASMPVRNFVNQATQDLEVGAPPKKSAPLLPVVLIGSLELLVMCNSEPLYARALAWYKLLKLWTASRTGDLTSLRPSSLRLTSFGLVGCLERTKTTGPGKRVRHLPIFICRSAYLLAPGWLEKGLEIWESSEFAFDRDYFLPLPSADWASVRPVMADFADSTALSKRLFRALKQPVRQNGHWVSSVVPLFCAEAALSFWTEHSERNWLNSHLAVIGVPQCERDFIGRWRITSSADEYQRLAQRVVINAQEQLLTYFAGNDKWDLSHAGVQELEKFLRQRHVPEALITAQCIQLQLPAQWCSRVPEPMAPAPVLPEPAPVQACDNSQVENPAEDAGQSPYFVVVIGKKNFRRLHRRGGCGVSAIEVGQSEPCWSLQGLTYDLACRHCWKRGNATVSEAEEADDSEDSDESVEG